MNTNKNKKFLFVMGLRWFLCSFKNFWNFFSSFSFFLFFVFFLSLKEEFFQGISFDFFFFLNGCECVYVFKSQHECQAVFFCFFVFITQSVRICDFRLRKMLSFGVNEVDEGMYVWICEILSLIRFIWNVVKFNAYEAKHLKTKIKNLKKSTFYGKSVQKRRSS